MRAVDLSNTSSSVSTKLHIQAGPAYTKTPKRWFVIDMDFLDPNLSLTIIFGITNLFYKYIWELRILCL